MYMWLLQVAKVSLILRKSRGIDQTFCKGNKLGNHLQDLNIYKKVYPAAFI